MILTDAGFNVLVIEDDFQDYTVLQDFILEGFDSPNIAQHHSLENAMESISNDVAVDIILFAVSDVHISNRKLQKDIDSLLRKCPIIVITDNTTLGLKCLSFGACDYLLKKELNAHALHKSIIYSSERYKNLVKLKESEEKYKNLFKRSPLPKWIYDIETLYLLDANDAAIEEYGYSRSELMEMKITDFPPDEDVPVIENIVSLVREDGTIIRKSTSRLTKKNGDIINVQFESSELTFEGKEARMVLGIDITKHLNSENVLRESESRFKAMIKEGSDLISILNIDGVITYASPNHPQIVGFETGDVLGKNIFDLVHPNDVGRISKLYEKLIIDKQSFSSQFRLKRADGTYIWLESIVTNALENAVQGVIVNSRDITERAANEKSLKETNERFQAIARATSDAIYDFDFISRKAYITGSNYHALFGYVFENHTTDIDFFKECLHPDDRERVYKMLETTVISPQSNHFEIEYRLIKSDGSYADVLDRFNILWSNGYPVRKVGAMQDITTKKFQETTLALEKEIYELNADPKVSFNAVVDKLVLNIELLIPGAACVIFSITDDAKTKFLAGHSIDKNYVYGIDGYELTPAAMAYISKSFFVSNLEADPTWNLVKDSTEPAGYKACWSVPVKKRNGKILASFSCLFKTIRTATNQEINLLERATNLMAILLENRSAFIDTERAKERYDIVAKATSDTIWDWNIQEDDFSWNKGIQGVFGYKKENVGKSSKWWFDRIHPEDSIRLSIKLYNFLEEKVEKWQDEYRFACADGTYKYVFDRGFLVKDSNGKAVRMIGAMQDVTRQKQEEQRLKLLETVITQSKDSVIITEAEKSSNGVPKIVFVNPAFSTMTGYKSGEVVGKSPAIFMGRKSVAGEIAKLSEALKNKKEFKFETLNNRKNGDEYWVNFSMIPITNKEGEHSHWISIQRDITDEKKQEKEKEQLIRELTQNNKDLKQFSYITSHNLRAPLSNLTGLLNLMEDIPIDNDELKEILHGFSKSTHLLNETINDLVKVVIIKDNPSIQKEEVLIKDVFENVFHQLSFLIGMHKPIIKIELEKVSIINTNKAYLESILLNLMTNAIKYRSTNRQLKINISSKEINNNIIVTFKDNGIGIDLERNADKIFGLYQRFHNYPDSKGLGLYLVKSQVETMGGTIAVQSEVNKGTTFVLTFKNK